MATSETALTTPPMAAPAADQSNSVPDMILNSDDATWRRLQAALGTATREDAAALVQQDQGAMKVAASILGAGTALTNSAPSAADTLYGGSRQTRGKVGF